VFRFVEPNGGRIFHDKWLWVKRSVRLLIVLMSWKAHESAICTMFRPEKPVLIGS
jgi:hypothetical protein